MLHRSEARVGRCILTTSGAAEGGKNESEANNQAAAC